MRENPPPDHDGTSLNRRQFIAVGGGVGAVLLAGCVGDDSPSDGDAAETATGSFRLLISDQPVAIDEFDSLEVTLDRARVFGDPDESRTDDGGGEGPDDGGDDTNPDDGGDDTNPDDGGGEGPGQRGFFVTDLDGATVDLTEVIGERAIEVFNGELPAGQYTKIELYPEDVGGIVDDEAVTVHVPSDKLQITVPFEIEAGETLAFVFDINVVRRGQTGEYNLTPVIAESGVAGEDVEVEEIETEDGENSDDTGDDGTEPGPDDPER